MGLKKRRLLILLALAACLPAASAYAAVSGTLSITSSTHSVNVSSTNSTVSLAWSGVTAGNGNITYEYVLDTNATLSSAAFTAALTAPQTPTLKSGNLGSATSITFSDQVDGTFYFHLRGYDNDGPAGGTGVVTFGPIILNSAPTVSTINPASGSHASAINVTINGSNFMNGATVDLVQGTTTVALTNVTFVSSTQLTATVPKGTPPGTYDVRVTNAAPFSKQFTKTSAYKSTNTAPVADPGADQALTLSGANVTLKLTGAASTDADGDTISSYTWTTVADPSGTLQATYTGSVQNLTVNKAGTYTFSLVVSDGYANSSAVQINYVVSSPQNNPPTANAGADQLVAPNTVVTLNGNQSSDPDGDPLTYAWTVVSQPTGANITLATSTTTASFTPTISGTYTIKLIVNDGTVDSTPDQVVVTVNKKPTANAGTAQLVPSGQLVTLDGTGSSDPENGRLTYAWSITSQPTGSNISLSSATAAKPTFTPTVAGAYVFSLTVNDGLQDSASASTVTITVNNPPTANAGTNKTVLLNQPATLDGTGSSDPDGDTLTYAWTVVSQPTGSNISLSSATAAQPTFTPTVAGDYVFSLTVNDGLQDSASAATVTYTAVSASAVTLDVDGSGLSDANDGVMILRRLNGAQTVTTGIVLPAGATNTSVVSAIDNAGTSFDVDGDGDADANDGVMILRRLNAAQTVTTGIVLPTNVGGAGANGERSNAEVVTAIDGMK